MDYRALVVLVVGALLLQAGAYGVVAGDTGSMVAQSDAETANATTANATTTDTGTTDETGESGFPESVYADSDSDSDDEATAATTITTTTTVTDTETPADDSSAESTPSADSGSSSPSSDSDSTSSDSGLSGTSAPVSTIQPSTPTAQPGTDGGTTGSVPPGGTDGASGGSDGAPGTVPSNDSSAPGGSGAPDSSTPGGSGAPPGAAPGDSAGASPQTGGAPSANRTGADGVSGAGGAGGAGGTGAGDTTAGSAGAGAAPVSPDAEFEVASSSIDAAAGSDGTLTVRLENTGEDAENAVVTLQSGSGELTFGGAPSTSQFVGEFEEGDTKTIEVGVTVAPGSADRSYPVTATVAYDDDGDRVQSSPTTFGVTPGGEQDFALDSVESSLSAGSDGTISGTIINEGPETAENAVLVFAGNTSDITPRQSEVVLGDIESGESVDFEYPVSVRPGAAPGDRQVPFVVQYQNEDGDPLQSGTLNAQVTIDEAADDLEVVDVDSDLEPGESGTVEVTLENTGEDAEDAVVNLQSLSGVVLFGQSPNTSQYVGEWEAGDRETIEVSATAMADVAEGEYPMQASLSYTDGDNEPGQSGPVIFGVPVGESADEFAVVSTRSNVPIGEEGTVSVTLNNTGENVTEATVSLSSLSPDLVVGSTGNATRFVGEWPAGEQRTVEFQTRASNDTERRSYPLRVSTSYTDSDGDRANSDARTFGVTPLREQAFTLQDVSGNLSVGEEGTVTGTVVNEGPSEARNAVITLQVDNQNVNPQETEFALGTLAAGESANFSFPIEVTDSAEGGVRQLSFAVEYDNSEGDSRESDTLSTQVDVSPPRDEFTVTRQNASLDVGATETVDLEIINNKNNTVRNINAKAFADSPLSLADDEAFITELGPGENATITFEVSSTGSATAGTYPLSLDFQYDTADGESKLSETYDVPIEVREPESGGLLSLGGDGGFPILPILLAVLLVVIIAAVVIRRRNGDGGGGSGNGGGSGGNDGTGGGGSGGDV